MAESVSENGPSVLSVPVRFRSLVSLRTVRRLSRVSPTLATPRASLTRASQKAPQTPGATEDSGRLLLVSRSLRLLRPGSVSDPRPLSRWQVLLLGVAPGSAIRSRDAPLRVGIPVASFGSPSRLVSYRPEGAVPAGQRAGPAPPAPPPVPACSSIFLACEVLGPPATAHAARRQAPIGASSSSHLGLQLIPISASSSPPSQPPFPPAATPPIPSG